MLPSNHGGFPKSASALTDVFKHVWQTTVSLEYLLGSNVNILCGIGKVQCLLQVFDPIYVVANKGKCGGQWRTKRPLLQQQVNSWEWLG